MVGTHALYLSTFMSGLKVEHVAADFQTYVEGRQLEDNANILLRFSNGATGIMWNSYVAAGVENGLRVRIFCEKGSLDWIHENPNQLHLMDPGEPKRTLTLGSRPALPGGRGVSIAAVQPEGFVEAFTNVYNDVADAIIASAEGYMLPDYPNEADGALGVRFVAAAAASNRQGAVWMPV
jgi:predicted dehydrogenase